MMKQILPPTMWIQLLCRRPLLSVTADEQIFVFWYLTHLYFQCNFTEWVSVCVYWPHIKMHIIIDNNNCNRSTLASTLQTDYNCITRFVTSNSVCFIHCFRIYTHNCFDLTIKCSLKCWHTRRAFDFPFDHKYKNKGYSHTMLPLFVLMVLEAFQWIVTVSNAQTNELTSIEKCWACCIFRWAKLIIVISEWLDIRIQCKQKLCWCWRSNMRLGITSMP